MSDRSHYILYLLLTLILLGAIKTVAQEQTESPTPPAVATTEASPTATPTLTNTPTSTNTFTPEATSTENIIVTEAASESTALASPTDEITATTSGQIEVTEEVTEAVLAEITGEAEVLPVEVNSTPPAPEPEPPLVAIVSDPFIANTNLDWTLGTGWQIVSSEGNYALQGTGNTDFVTYSPQTFTDLSVEAIVQSRQLTAELYLRQTATESYRLSLSPDGDVAIYRNEVILATASVASSANNHWRHVRFSAIGHTLRAAIDGVEVIVITDAQPLNGGTVAFRGTIGNNSNQTLLVDNVRIWVPQNSVPTEPTPTLLPPATSTPVVPESGPGWVSYPDTAPEFYYGDGIWQAINIAEALDGTLTATDDPGASFRLAFQGTGIQIVYSKAPDAGSFTATLDDVTTQVVDSYSATPTYQNTVVFENLTDGFHTVHIVNQIGNLYIEGIYLQGTLPSGEVIVSGNLSQSTNLAVQQQGVLETYSYNFDDIPNPNTMTALVIDNSEDRIPTDGVPGTVYYVGNSFDYYDSSGQLLTFNFNPELGDLAIGGVSHTNAAIASYQVKLEVEFDFQDPVRFIDYDFLWAVLWNRAFSSHPIHLKLTLEDSNKDLLFEGIICETIYTAPDCNDSTAWNRFAPVDDVRYVTVTLETSDPNQDMFAYTYYHVLDNFTFEVESTSPNVCTIPGQFQAQGQTIIAQQEGVEDCNLGIHAEYFPGFQVTDAQQIARTSVLGTPLTFDGNIAFASASDWSLPNNNTQFSTRWTGMIIVPAPVEPTPTPTDPSPTPTNTPSPTPVGTPTGLNLTLDFSGLNSSQDGIRVWIDPGQNGNWQRAINTWGTSSNGNLTLMMNNISYDTPYPIWIEYYHYDRNSTIVPILQMNYSLSTGEADIVPTGWLRPVDPDNPNFYNDGNYVFTAPVLDELSFNQMASCASNTVTIVPVYPGRSVEAQDMMAIAQDTDSPLLAGNGLIQHDGPVVNSNREDFLAWGSTRTVDRYMIHPQLLTNSQLWMRLLGTDSWINTRWGIFNYIVGQDAQNNPCASSIMELADSETINFTYNRRVATTYAIAHAYRNSYPEAQTQSNYPGPITRVTNYIPLENVGSVTIPYAEDIPFGNFSYDITGVSVSDDAANEGTGSADFISEVLFIGGMPHTEDINPNFTCQETPSPDNYANSGWRFCPEDGGSDRSFHSLMWRTHIGIVEYYADFSRTPSVQNNLLLDANISTNKGQLIGIFYLRQPIIVNGEEQNLPWADINNNYGTLSGGFNLLGDGSDTTLVTQFFNDYIGDAEFLDSDGIGREGEATDFEQVNPAISGNIIDNLEAGDYILSDAGNGHGFIVVGWGQIMSCPQALMREWHLETTAINPLYPTYSDASNANLQMKVVPYVVDFPGGVDNGQLQRPRPRPFYCAQSPDPGFFRLDRWEFYHLPSTITLRNEQFYVSPAWAWDQTRQPQLP